jgi:hypothetical protein
LTCPTLFKALSADLELIENKDNAGSRDNCANQDGQWDHIALVLPVHNPAMWAATAKKSMGIPFLTVTARSCDGFKHPLILASWRLAAIDPHQYHSSGLVELGNSLMDFKYHLICINASGGIGYQHQGMNSNCNNILSLPIFPCFFAGFKSGPILAGLTYLFLFLMMPAKAPCFIGIDL